ncbi:MAG: hypothetical protein LBV18_03190 [Alistipes sp.]|jgi:hypothetical protein|nr:hypothetical protein [Alistipes sp.]
MKKLILASIAMLALLASSHCAYANSGGRFDWHLDGNTYVVEQDGSLIMTLSVTEEPNSAGDLVFNVFSDGGSTRSVAESDLFDTIVVMTNPILLPKGSPNSARWIARAIYNSLRVRFDLADKEQSYY